MDEEEKPDPYYMRQAGELMRVLFDKGFLARDVSMESLDDLRVYIAWHLQFNAESAVRIAALVKKARGGV